MSRPGASDVSAVVASLKRLGNKRVLGEMSTRYGVHTAPGMAFGVMVSKIQQVAKGAKRKMKGEGNAAWNHALAAQLWETGYYEARMAASFIDEPLLVTAGQMDRWCRDFDNWGICDTVCFKLFDQVSPDLAFRKVKRWAAMKGEFQRRGGYVLLACLALHRKELNDEQFLNLLPLIERGAIDDRNFVKKGVSWALRSIGGRSAKLLAASNSLAHQLAKSPNTAARWIGKEAMREFAKARSGHRR